MKRIVFTIGLFFLLTLAIFVGQPNKSAKTPHSNSSSDQSNTLRIAFGTSPVTFDPRKSGDFTSSTIICLIYEGLTRCLPGGEVEPALAQKIDISPDGLTYTFHLRKAFWTDGRPITAQDFEKSWKQILDPEFPSLSSYLLFPIKNAEAYAKGQVLQSGVAITALDPSTFQVQLERPTPYFLSLTAFPLFLPIPSTCEAVSNESPICSGPFYIESFTNHTEVHLLKNPAFWNAKGTILDAIHIHIVPEESTALHMFERGELDWVGGPHLSLPPDLLSPLQDRLQFCPMAASTFCAFNLDVFPLNHTKIRQALALALDREKIVSEVALVGQIPAVRFLPPSLFSELNPKPLLSSFDPKLAQSLFNEALFELGTAPADLPLLSLCYKTGQVNKRIAQAIQHQWKEVLGFNIQIEQLDPKIHMERLHRRNHQIALASWIAQFHDPVNLLERYRLRSNPKNFSGWYHPDFEALITQAEATIDPKQRLSLLAQAEEVFALDMPILPLYHWTAPSLSSPRIREVPRTPSGGILFERFVL